MVQTVAVQEQICKCKWTQQRKTNQNEGKTHNKDLLSYSLPNLLYILSAQRMIP